MTTLIERAANVREQASATRAAIAVLKDADHPSWTTYSLMAMDLEGIAVNALCSAWESLQRLVTGEYPTVQIDHRDRDPANNRWKNLRPAPGSGNHWNRDAPTSNKSGHKGVLLDKRSGRWRAYASAHRRQHSFGVHATFEAACAAQEAGARALHGEFA